MSLRCAAILPGSTPLLCEIRATPIPTGCYWRVCLWVVESRELLRQSVLLFSAEAARETWQVYTTLPCPATAAELEGQVAA
jgi:hypothetical protein